MYYISVGLILFVIDENFILYTCAIHNYFTADVSSVDLSSATL